MRGAGKIEMMENSKIEWTHHTANLWWGCTEVHAGCDNCYARVFSNRWNDKLWGNDVPRKEIPSVWKNLAKFQNHAKESGEMHRVFVGSMMDIFEKPMPVIDKAGNLIPSTDTGELRRMLFADITAGLYPNLIFLFLTKRPSNINKYIPEEWLSKAPDNVMFGTSPVDQKTADTLIPQLLKVNGKRFLSVEPQLDSINIQGHLFHNHIDWVIQGGESGHHKRPFNLDWAYYLKQQCHDTMTPYFFKQIDKVQAIPEDLMIRQFPVHNSLTPSHNGR